MVEKTDTTCTFSHTEIDENISENAKTVLERRYLKKGGDGVVAETPRAMLRRVSENIAQAELEYNEKADISTVADEFYYLMSNLYFLPNSPTLMNAGRSLQQLSACFVLPVEDSMEGIFETIKNGALIHKSGGGTGYSFSRLRPKNDTVCSTQGVSSGPISFMKAFDAATETVKQGGTRRGANMALLSIDHPDILDFISCKADNNELNNFNISVGITEEFMEAVESGSDYNLINPRDGKVHGTLNAADVFNTIVELSWKNGEPGIVFLDRMNADNPTPEIGAIESTNPCGEQPLLPYEACNLGSINLARMVKEEHGVMQIDYDLLGCVVDTSVRFLDNVVEMSKFPLPQIAEMVSNNRKIGLGVMGFADMLIMLGIPYNSDEGIEIGKVVMRFIQDRADAASRKLVEERGAFPNVDKSIYKDAPIRNATRTTIAPTGTLSIIANCSSGVEPLFALSFTKHVMDDDRLVEVNPLFEKKAKEMGFYSPELMEQIAKSGSIHKIHEIPESVRKVFVTSHDISPEWHIKMQAAFQEFTDNAVSKTVNFSNSATEDDIRQVYLLAYKLKCKGVTVYRDGSRDVQVLNVAESEKKKEDEEEIKAPRRRPTQTTGRTIKMSTACGNLYVTINEDETGLCEVFSTMGKSGGCSASFTEAVSRMISLSLRADVDAESIIRQLKGIRCPTPKMQKGGTVFSCSDAIGQALEMYVENRTPLATEEPRQLTLDGSIADHGYCPDCPECGSMLEMSEGCMKCRSCGFSRCS